MKKSLMIPAIVILLSQFVFAQNPQWIHYRTINSGLPNNNIQSLAIERDSNGRNIIWMGTGLSLTKFDGSNWTVYDSTATGFRFFIISIRFDSKKNTWMGTTNAGLIKFDRKSWTVFNTSNSQIHSHYVPYIEITSDDLILIGSRLWGNQAYIEFDGVDNWTIFDSTQIPSNLRVQRILHERSTNNRWIGCYRSLGGVLYNGNEFKIYSTTNSGISSNSIFGLAIDENHNKFFGPEVLNGISRLDSTNTHWSVIGNYAAHDMAFDREGKLWWIVEGVQAQGGLFKATTDFDTIKVWNASNSPLVSEPECIAIDSNGNKWIGTGGGLFVFNEDGIVNIDDNNLSIPDNFVLHQNTPNPFNPQTLIKFDVSKSQYAKLRIFNSIGQNIATLVDGKLNPGSYEILWDGRGFPSGIYFYSLEIDGELQTRKMILLK